MDAAVARPAIAAARTVVEAAGLPSRDAEVLHDSNRLAVRFRGCDLVARVAPADHRPVAAREVDVAARLGATGAPIGGLDRRFEPRVHARDEFIVTMWAYCQPVGAGEVAAEEYAEALARLHAGMRSADLSGLAIPDVFDRVDEAQVLLEDATNNPAIDRFDRELLIRAIETSRRAIVEHETAHQLIHGEPHPGNVIATVDGPVFVDFETVCRGPIEFDIAHAAAGSSRLPMQIASHYARADADLVRHCRVLSLALAVAWRCERGDDLPNGAARARAWIVELRDEMER